MAVDAMWTRLATLALAGCSLVEPLDDFAAGATASGAGGSDATATAASTSGSGGFGGAASPCVDGHLPLSDDFGLGIATSQWNIVQANNGFVDWSDDYHYVRTFVGCCPGTNAVASVKTVQLYELTGCSMFIKVMSTEHDAYTFLLADDPQHGIRMSFAALWGQLIATLDVNGAVTKEQTVFQGDAQSWWRIREDDRTIHWETSADGLSWVAYWTAPTPADLGDVFVEFGMHTSVPETEANFDNFNVGPGG